MPHFARRQRLTPGQARIVASWRFDDAVRLWKSGLPKHMNGAVYLGGLSLDCLLKAPLLEKHPALGRAAPGDLGPLDRARWELVFRVHDLETILLELPELLAELRARSILHADRLDTMLRSACAKWSVHIRYHPKRLDTKDAEEFLEQVKELRRWL